MRRPKITRVGTTTDPFDFYPGNDRLSHALPRAVPWALEGLTTVFGMGTGVSPPVKSPETFKNCPLSVVRCNQRRRLLVCSTLCRITDYGQAFLNSVASGNCSFQPSAFSKKNLSAEG